MELSTTLIVVAIICHKYSRASLGAKKRRRQVPGFLLSDVIQKVVFSKMPINATNDLQKPFIFIWMNLSEIWMDNTSLIKKRTWYRISSLSRGLSFLFYSFSQLTLSVGIWFFHAVSLIKWDVFLTEKMHPSFLFLLLTKMRWRLWTSQKAHLDPITRTKLYREQKSSCWRCRKKCWMWYFQMVIAIMWGTCKICLTCKN